MSALPRKEALISLLQVEDRVHERLGVHLPKPLIRGFQVGGHVFEGIELTEMFLSFFMKLFLYREHLIVDKAAAAEGLLKDLRLLSVRIYAIL